MNLKVVCKFDCERKLKKTLKCVGSVAEDDGDEFSGGGVEVTHCDGALT